MSSNPETPATPETHIPYPKGAYFILISEFLERFSYYGMRALLVLYFTNILYLDNDMAKEIFHLFACFNYVTPLIGAIVSDSWLEKFKTIFFASIIYVSGDVLLTFTSIDFFKLPKFFFTMVSLALIALGSGALKPCYAAFAGDQFKLPEQEHMISKFFLIFYFSINIGSLISMLLTPYLRDLKCLGQDSCYPLAYFVVAVSVGLYFVFFLLGRPFYIIKGQPQGNIFVLVFKCIFHALRKKMGSKETKEHWLDHAKDKYDEQLVEDVKITLSALFIFVPIPIFWALYEQQSSDWIILAARLSGDIGFYTILPEQMQAVNPVVIVLLIPLFHSVVYPFFEKIHLFHTPIQRMVLGGLLTALAFVISAFLHLAVLNELPPMPENGMIQLRGYNPRNTPATVSVYGIDEFTSFEIPAFGFYENLNIAFNGKRTVLFNGQSIEVSEDNAYGVYLFGGSTVPFVDNLEKPVDKYPRIRLFLESEKELFLINLKEGTGKNIKIKPGDCEIKSVDPNGYKVEGIDTELDFKTGGVYAIMINNANKVILQIPLLKENAINILWLIPQNVALAAGEIMISVTGLEFAYSQAPLTMKSFLQASWNLTTAFGNLIVVFVTTFVKLKNPAWDACLYAILMLLNMLLLILIARSYKYKELTAAELARQESVAEATQE